MRFSELTAMNSSDLHAELERIARHIFDLRGQAVTEKLGNPHSIREARKDVARVKTILRQRGEKL